MWRRRHLVMRRLRATESTCPHNAEERNPVYTDRQAPEDRRPPCTACVGHRVGHWSFTQALRRGQWVQLRCELQLLPPLRRVPSYDAAASQPAFELRAPRLEHGDRAPLGSSERGAPGLIVLKRRGAA